MDVLQISWKDIPGRGQEWYDNEATRMTVDEIAAELDISYEKSSRAVVYKEFKDAHILRGDWKPDPNLPVIRILDYGKTCACLFAQKDAFDRMTFFHEIVLIDEENPTDKLGRAGKSYSTDLVCQGFKDHDDPAGKTDNYVNADETSYKVIRKYGFNPTHTVSQASAARRRNRVDQTKYFLAQFPEGQPQIRVHESMHYTIQALQGGYRHKVDRNTQEVLDDILEEHPHEDVADCFGIAIVEQLTVKRNRPKNKRKPPRRKRNPYTGY